MEAGAIRPMFKLALVELFFLSAVTLTLKQPAFSMARNEARFL
jgi:hypothetical protein